MFDHLKVGRKLLVLSTVFLVPVAFLAWLLVMQSQKEITFAEKERDGGRYLTSLARLEVDLVAARYGGAKAAVSSALKAVSADERQLSEEMDTAELFAAMRSAVETVGKPASGAPAFDTAVDSVRALISRVGDSSNLILDPDLDSYYAMDISVLKLPELVDASVKVLDAAGRLLAMPKVEVAQAADLLTRLGAYQDVVEAVAASLESGYRGNVDQRMRSTLETIHTAFRKEALTFGEALGQVAEGAKVEAATLQRLHTATVQQSDRLWSAVIAEMDRLLVQRIDGFYRKLWISLGAALAVVVLALILANAAARSINRPLVALNAAMGALASGRREVEVPFAARRDEVGDMARALQVFKDGLIEADSLAERERADQVERDRRAQHMQELTKTFNDQVAGVLGALEKAASAMGKTSSDMRATTGRASQQAAEMEGAVEQTSTNVQAVASAAEELAGSIGEVSRQVAHASEIAASAVADAEAANGKVQGLADAVRQIGKVVALITDIADQTNLLALNATIEAARAGDAGKGFAVVASEVKNLANQTARATEEISAQIAGIQESTQEAVTAIELIGKTISDIDEVNAGVAAAVGEQGAATQEIARNAELAAGSTVDMGRSVAEVRQAVDRTGASTDEVTHAAAGLTQEADALKQCVGGFLDDVRAS